MSFEHGGRKFLLIVVYKPPHINNYLLLYDFRLYMEDVDTVNANTFICGDFNFWFEDLNNHDANGHISVRK